ncbi:hypothetical protein DFH06DRAFT_1442278 [Mycena polygramma]|nr:hypothetical protein DFH06DRAFT_1442278 [Mycena polygramma]
MSQSFFELTSRRVALACSNCRERKVKCVHEARGTSCMRCMLNGLSCQYLATEKQQNRSCRKNGPRRTRPRPPPPSPQEPVTPHDNDSFSGGGFGQAPFEAETSQSPVTPVYPVPLTTTHYDAAPAPHYDGVSYAAPHYPPPSHQHALTGAYCGQYTTAQTKIQPPAMPHSFSTPTLDLTTPTVYPTPATNGDFYGWGDSSDYSAGWSDSPDYSDYSWTDSPGHVAAAYVWGQEVSDSCYCTCSPGGA